MNTRIDFRLRLLNTKNIVNIVDIVNNWYSTKVLVIPNRKDTEVESRSIISTTYMGINRHK